MFVTLWGQGSESSLSSETECRSPFRRSSSSSLIGVFVSRMLGRQSGRGFDPLLTETGGEVSPEGRRVEAVDERVTAGVEVPEHEEHVVNVFGRDAQHVGLEPVPDPQQVVRRPADHEGEHDDHRHPQRLQTSLGDDVGSTAPQVRLTC